MGNSKKGIGENLKISRFEVKRDTIDNKLLKEKYPQTYEAVLKNQTKYVNMRITECK